MARSTSAGPAFDLVFLDPPYAQGLGERALAELAEHGWLKPGAALVFERGEGEPDIQPEGFDLIDERRYGAAKVLFLTWPGGAEAGLRQAHRRQGGRRALPCWGQAAGRRR